ncbi:8-oxoguanine DNA glycosylase [Clostridia bacterium]|nr:8-oxoguanine DNA glycosylase [Clostridia bacterium]
MKAAPPNFSMRVIMNSGQCFRIREPSPNSYSLFAYGRQLRVAHLGGDNYDFDCSPDEFDGLWRQYFDLDTDYGRYFPDNPTPFVERAFAFGRGMKMLRQEPWEMVVSYIISQRKNIPAIQGCIEKLCALCGEKAGDGFEFPTREALAEADLSGCSLGYRDKYVRAAATCGLDFAALKTLDDGKLRETLLSLYGVGEKVAACVMLCGYGRLNSFPVDVWIRRVIEREHGGETPDYGENAGIINQYLFYYIRSNWSELQ